MLDSDDGNDRLTRMVGRRTLLGLLAAGALGSALPAVAADPVDPAKFVREFGNEALARIRKDADSQARMEADFRELLAVYFDMNSISRLVLVRYWRSASPDEFAEFIELFKQLLAQTYASRLSQVSGGLFNVVTTATDRPEPGGAIVSSQLGTAGSPSLRAIWALKNVDGQYRVIDVTVESISMVATFRDEFGSLIRSSGGQFAGLNDALRTRVGGKPSQVATAKRTGGTANAPGGDPLSRGGR